MMAEDRWRTWDEIEAEAKEAGRLDEARVAAHRERMRAEQRAYRLAEIRRQQGLTQTDVAAAMHVSQRRVSAVERGDLSRTELGTVASYIEAIGGKVEIVADFGDERVVIGLRAAGTKHRHLRYPRRARRESARMASPGRSPPRWTAARTQVTITAAIVNAPVTMALSCRAAAGPAGNGAHGAARGAGSRNSRIPEGLTAGARGRPRAGR
jgi:transcriptional regulator with XRE-family HTH domain